MGGPLPRARRPRSGRVLSRGISLPRDRAAHGVSAHAGNARSRVPAAPSTDRLLAERHWRASKLHAQSNTETVARMSHGFSVLVRRHLDCLSANSCARPLRSAPTEPHPAPHSWRRRTRSSSRLCGSDDLARSPRPASTPHDPSRDLFLPLMSGPAIPRRSMCDDVAGEALEATRLRRVLHCVSVPGATQASLGMPQASSPPRYAHAGGGLASAGTTKGPVSWLPSDP